MSDPPDITLERITNIPNRLQLRDGSNEIICPVLRLLYNKGYIHVDEDGYTEIEGMCEGTDPDGDDVDCIYGCSSDGT